jgi:hypothetical protein
MKRPVSLSVNYFCQLFSSFLVASPLCYFAYAQNNEAFYTVQLGDTFSKIIYEKMGSPLYGEKGSLKKFILLNNQIKNPHRIKPGDIIQLNETEVTKKIEIEPIYTEKKPASYQSVFPYSLFSFAPSFYFSTLKGKDLDDYTTAEFVSSVNILLKGAWTQKLTEKFETHLQAHLRKETYQSSGSIDLKNTSLTQGSFGFGARYSLNENYAMNSLLSFSQETFYRAKNAGSLTLESLTIPRLALGLDYKIIQFHQYRLDFHGAGMVMMPTKSKDYDLDLGTGYKTALSLTEEMNNSNKTFGCDFSFTYFRQDSNLIELTKKELGFGCNLSWRMGEVSR